MRSFVDIATFSVSKSGEELCGDKIKILRERSSTIAVLSDGLGSGVKANILATLTAEIIVHMLARNCSLDDVVETVANTLPVDQVRGLAYATFTIVQHFRDTGEVLLANFDNPPALWFRQRALFAPAEEVRELFGRRVIVQRGALREGDLLVAISDGALYAGLGTTMNFGWGRENIARFVLEQLLYGATSAEHISTALRSKTEALYSGVIGDDASCLAFLLRPRRSLILFTGPPARPNNDAVIVQRLVTFDGRRVVCGGTSGNIVGRVLKREVEVDLTTIRRDVPPIGIISGIDLVTEGILTMSQVLKVLRRTDCRPDALPRDRNGATLLASELVNADSITFIVGEKINEYYQNPALPLDFNIRKSLISEMVALLRDHGREVMVEYL